MKGHANLTWVAQSYPAPNDTFWGERSWCASGSHAFGAGRLSRPPPKQTTVAWLLHYWAGLMAADIVICSVGLSQKRLKKLP